MTRYWAADKASSSILFYSMHPGWCDTPGVQTSLPSFHRALQGKLRTLAQGADTVVWASLTPALGNIVENGSFLQDRKAVPTSLFLSDWTRSNEEQVEAFMSNLQSIKSRF